MNRFNCLYQNIYGILEYIFELLAKIWHYPILITDQSQKISISNIVIALTLLAIGIRISGSLSRSIRKRFIKILRLERSVSVAIEKITYYVFLAIVSLIALDIANVPLTAFTFIGGALAIGLSLGTKELINDFVGGFIIMIERPIRIGDIVEVDDKKIYGKVVSIGARCTKLLTGDNIDIIIPNRLILQNTLTNLTLTEEGKLRHVIDFSVAQEGNDEKFIRQLIEEVMNNNNEILLDPKPCVLLDSISNRYLNFKIQFWINMHGPIARPIICSNIYFALLDKMKQNNIKITAIPEFQIINS